MECERLNGKDVELVAPVDLRQNDDIGNEDEAVAEDEAEVGRQSQQVEEPLVVVELGLGGLKAEEATVKHLATFEIDEQGE